MITKLTKEQALVITGFTGLVAINMGEFQEDVQNRLGYMVATHELPLLAEQIQELYREDFIAMCSP